MSKSHPDQWEIGTEVERPDPALVAELGRARDHADRGLRRPGRRRRARASAGSRAAPGCAGPPSPSGPSPATSCSCSRRCDLVAPGDVLLIDGGGREDAAVIGDIVGKTLADLGCVGLVVDGAVRDVDGLDEAGLPTFARGAHPATGSNTGPRRDQRDRAVRRGRGVSRATSCTPTAAAWSSCRGSGSRRSSRWPGPSTSGRRRGGPRSRAGESLPVGHRDRRPARRAAHARGAARTVGLQRRAAGS